VVDSHGILTTQAILGQSEIEVANQNRSSTVTKEVTVVEPLLRFMVVDLTVLFMNEALGPIGLSRTCTSLAQS